MHFSSLYFTASRFSFSRASALRFCRSLAGTTACILALAVPAFPAQSQTATALSSSPANPIPAAYLPPSSLLDMSRDSAASIDKRGFVTVGSDGHFRFAEGSRARFWGINVSSTRLNVPNEQIERAVANFAAAGLNMVRLEAIDNRNCLLGSQDAPDSLHFDLKYLDRLDYWMDCLRRHGIYYYLDMLDFRTFKTGDGVLNAGSMDRGARPYALFDRYLIQLQKEYASHLLLHKNPYSKLYPVDDPALALVEICNEHGFFIYPEKLEALVEPYRSDLRARWGKWLRDKYGSREQLSAAWGAINGTSVLQDGEDPDRGSVDLPLLTGSFTSLPANEADVHHADGRVRDGVQFLAELQRLYFREMRAHLRAIGLHCPVTAVVTNGSMPDVAGVAQECDFTAENWYGEGVNGDPRTPGLRYYSNRNSLRDDSQGGFAPYTASLRWNNKPVVIREWATTWPNTSRAVSVPEALAYASLQDYDAILLFGYQTNRAPNGALADALNDFAFQADPTTWGLAALAGQAFLSRAIKPADHVVEFSYPPERLYAWPNNAGSLYRAAWTVRLNNVLVSSARPNAITPLNSDGDASTLRLLLDTVGKRGAPISAASVRTHVWRSDTGEIVRNAAEGRLEVCTPTLRMIAGEFAPGRTYAVGRLHLSTQTPLGALFALSLDGKPLETSQHLIVKMVSRAENTGQTLEKSPPGAINPWVLRAPGAGPVLTFGRPSVHPTRVWFTGAQESAKPKVAKPKTANKTSVAKQNGKPLPSSASPRPKTPPAAPDVELLTLYMVDGTWELEMRDGHATLACDTPNINGLALGRAFTTASQSMELAGLPPLPLLHPRALIATKNVISPAAPSRAALASRSGDALLRPTKPKK